MSFVASSDPEETRARRRAVSEINHSMRELAVQMTVLNLKAGEQVGLKDVDLKCLDILNRDGATSASALARRVGLHPATMTGVLDRLEKGGWVVRERDAEDRRAVLIRPVQERSGEIAKLFTGMNTLMNELLEQFDQQQLETVIKFIQATTETAKKAASQWGEG